MVESIFLSTFFLSCIITLVCINSNQVFRQRVLLASFFGFIALQTGIKYLGFATKFLNEHPVLLVLAELSAIIIPELIYLFVLAIVNKQVKSSLYLKLAIGPAVSTILFFTFYVLTNAFTENRFYAFEGFVGLFSITFIANVVFVVISLREIKNAIDHNLIDLSKHNHITLIWIKWLLWLLLIRALFSIAFFAMQFMFASAEWFPTAVMVQKYAVAIILLIATSLTAYYGLRNPMLFDTISEKPSVEQALAISILTPEVKKVIKKTIKEEDVMPYLAKIETTVKDEKLFLNPELTPALLAQRIAIPVYKLTLALNKGAGKNFNEFINQHRVEYAKELLTNPAHHRATIFSVALDSGFSSEAPFYAAFKKYVGQSPSAYRSNHITS